MRLVHRISAFFLTALAIALAVNALLLCSLAYVLLHQRFEEQLHSALNTLVAAVEVEIDEVKWEPSDHTIALGVDETGNEIRWAVYNEQRMLIDHSEHLLPYRPIDPQRLKTTHHDGDVSGSGEGVPSGWTFLQRELAAPHPDQAQDRGPADFDSLQIVIAGRPSGVWEMTTSLAGLVATVSITVWMIATIAGLWYCRRVLRPVQVMAQQAREVKSADFQMRWPTENLDEELAELSAAFNTLLDQQQQAFEQQRQFTGNAAHQLRTPLTVLLGQMEVALRRPRTTTEYQETLHILHVQTQELHGLVESLLYLARLEGDAVLPDVSEHSLNLFLQDYLQTWKEHPRFADLSIQLTSDLSLKTSWPLLKQLLDNLVSNALKYSDAETPVIVMVTHQENVVTIAVSDEGAGISENDRKRLFQPFFRSERTRQAGIEGVGLGLAVASRIACALGSELHYGSNENRGSRFLIRIPLRSRCTAVASSGEKSSHIISCQKETLFP